MHANDLMLWCLLFWKLGRVSNLNTVYKITHSKSFSVFILRKVLSMVSDIFLFIYFYFLVSIFQTFSYIVMYLNACVEFKSQQHT